MDDKRADPRASISFLTEFFRGTKEAVELRALPSKRRCFTRDSRKVSDFVEAHGREGVYFGSSTRKGGGNKGHCKEIPALWADIDFKTIPEEEAWELLRKFAIPPSVIVASGGGLHCYWLLAEHAPASDSRVEPILRGLARALRADPSAAELARIMRLPGTLNHKYDPPRACHVLEAHWDRRYTLSDFDSFAEEKHYEPKQANPDKRAEFAEGERNVALTRFAGKLRHAGLSEIEMRESLLSINRNRCVPPMAEAEVENIARSIARYQPNAEMAHSPQVLRAVSVRELLALQIKPREMLLDPILPAQALAMIHAKRGAGKTHLVLGIAVCGASGGSFLRWKAPKPRKVLLVDGELPGSVLQQWAAQSVAALGATDEVGDNLRIITPDLQERGIPDLSTFEGQAALLEHVQWADLIILDNLSALVRTGKENEAESWLPLQAWALNLRRQGKSVLFVHHSGRNGMPRGTSKREDLLDTIIALRQPANYNASEGLRAEVHFEKARHFHGPTAEPFEVELRTDSNGIPVWVVRDLQEAQYDRAAAMFADGCDARAVMEDLGVSRATAFRYQKRFRQFQSHGSPPME